MLWQRICWDLEATRGSAKQEVMERLPQINSQILVDGVRKALIYCSIYDFIVKFRSVQSVQQNLKAMKTRKPRYAILLFGNIEHQLSGGIIHVFIHYNTKKLQKVCL